MERVPQQPKPGHEEKDYFSMSYDEVLQLTPEELEEASREAGLPTDKFLELKQRSSANAMSEFTASKELERKEGPDSDFKRILRELPEIGTHTSLTAEEIEQGNRLEREAYDLLDTLTTDMPHFTYEKIRRQATALLMKAFQIQFKEKYAALLQQGASPERAFDRVKNEFENLGSYEINRNTRWEVRQAYREAVRDAEARSALMDARDAYISGTDKPEDRARWDRIRRTAYKGFAAGRITASMLDAAGLDGVERELTPLVFEAAKRIGVSSLHREADSYGSAEKFSSHSPDAYSRQNRPRRSNDDLEPF